MVESTHARSLARFQRVLRTERDCFEFLLRARWPEGAPPACVACGSTRHFASGTRLHLVCAACKHRRSVTAGTVMHGSRLPLSSWLLASWLLVADKRGVSACQIARALGVSYETAYMVLQRLRAGMVAPDREPLRGGIEVDETFLGGVRHGRPGMRAIGGPTGKFIVLGAVEVRGGEEPGAWRPGRLRLRHARDLGARTLIDFVAEVAAPGTPVATDGREAYARLPARGFPHRVESTSRGHPPEEVLPRLHLAFSNLKAWMAGTFHGAVEGRHLQGYLNEFCFRFNRRGNLFAAIPRLLELAGRVEGPTYEGIYAKGAGRFLHVREGAEGDAPPRPGVPRLVVPVYSAR